MTKAELLIYRMLQGCWVLVDKLPVLRLLKSVAVLELDAVYKDVYSAYILQI
jgi:hypothetical protein